jgi:hypothetical protein
MSTKAPSTSGSGPAAAAAPGEDPGRPATGAAVGPRPAGERSRQARQRAAAILEVLAGARTPLEAATALGVSLARYYLLEQQALAALVAGCELQPRGRRPDPARQVAALEQECRRWQRECARQQALVRAAHRALGLAAPPPAKGRAAGGKRKRRPVARALQAAQRLRPEEAAAGAGGAAPGATGG